MVQTLDEVLEHYGIKGMRWGVRRSERQLARARGKSSPKKKTEPKKSVDAAKAAAAAKKAKKGGVSSLSNKELQDLNTRLNLEQQYSRLADTGSSKKAAGAKFAKELVVSVGKQQATKLANDQVSKLLGTKGKKKDDK